MTPTKDLGEKAVTSLLKFDELNKTTKKSNEELKEIDKKFRQTVREKMEETIVKMIDLFVNVDDNASSLR